MINSIILGVQATVPHTSLDSHYWPCDDYLQHPWACYCPVCYPRPGKQTPFAHTHTWFSPITSGYKLWSYPGRWRHFGIDQRGSALKTVDFNQFAP